MRWITMARMVRKAIRTLKVSDATTVCLSGCARGDRNRKRFMLDSWPAVRRRSRRSTRQPWRRAPATTESREQGYTTTLVTMRPTSWIPTGIAWRRFTRAGNIHNDDWKAALDFADQ